MTVYVVFEENWCGMGTHIVGVYTSEDKARKVADESSRFYWDEVELDGQ